MLVGLAGIVAVAVLFFVAWRWGGTTPSSLPVPPPATQTVVRNAQLDTQPLTTRKRRKRHAAKAAAARRPPPPTTVKLVLRAVGGDSWLELRQGGAGPVIYAAVLHDGCSAGPVSFKSGFTIQNVPNPSYVHVVVNGKSYGLAGAGPTWAVTRRPGKTLVPDATPPVSATACATATTSTAPTTTG